MGQTADIINQFEERADRFSLAEISDKLRQLSNQEKETVEFRSESLIFSISDNYSHNDKAYGEYFGPMIEYVNGAVFPSFEMFTPQVISYWQKRVAESVNPLMKARYADALWDFGYLCNNSTRDYRYACIAVDNYLASVNTIVSFEVDIECVDMLSRAIEISKSINDQDRCKQSLNLLHNTYCKPIDNKFPGIWGGLFDIFLQNKKSFNTVDSQSFLESLELKFDSMIPDFVENSNAIECVLERMIKYHKINSQYDCSGRINQYRNAIENVTNMNPIQRIFHLEKALRFFNDTSMHSQANDLYLEISKESFKQKENLQKFEFSQTIPNEYVEKIQNVYKNEISIDEISSRLLSTALVSKVEIEKRTEELYKQYPLSFLISHQIVDEKGIIMFKYGSYDEDSESHIMVQYTQDINIKSVFIAIAFKGLLENENFTYDNVAEYMLSSPIAELDKKTLMKYTIKCFFNKDYISFINLSLPLIESLIRNAVLISNGQIIKETKDKKGYEYLLLHDLLRSEFIKTIIPEEIVYFFRVVLVEKRGLNLRNCILHGLKSDNVYNEQNAQLLFILLLFFGLFKNNPT